jgi:hypothetical protein
MKKVACGVVVLLTLLILSGCGGIEKDSGSGIVKHNLTKTSEC